MRYRALTIIAICFIFPVVSNAQVLLSEVAWMGTDADANNEWIELYNMGAPVDLAGWTISDGASLNIPLSGTIDGPHRIAVIERTDDNTVPGTALLIYTGALVDTGRTLTLKDASGATMDEAVGGTDWSGIGGDKTIPKKTPQRTRMNTWVTATPTPGADNAQENDPVATTTVTTTTTSSSNSSGSSSSRSSGSSSSRKSASEEKQKEVPPVLALSVAGPKTAYVNQEVAFEAVPSGVGKTTASSLSYDWNLGDTYTEKGKSVTHVFRYPGEYIVVVEGSFAKQLAMARHEVKVLPVSFSLRRTPEGDIELTNNASYEVDLGRFTLRGQTPFTFPKYTFIKGKGTLTIPQRRVGNALALSLHDGQGIAVVSTGVAPRVPQPSLATRPQPQVVAETLESDAPTASGENTVIRIGGDGTAQGGGILNRFFTRIARIFGS